MVWIIGIIGVIVCWITTTIQRYFVFKREVEYREFAIEHGVANKEVDNIIDELDNIFEEEAENE